MSGNISTLTPGPYKLAGILFGLVLFLYSSTPVFAGEIVVWGNSGASQNAPQAGSDFVSIAAGEEHSIALRSDGTMVTWEEDETTGAVRSISSLDSNYVAVATLAQDSLALRADGTIVGWGPNWFGESDSPPGNNYAAVATGVYHSLALRRDGSIFVFGWGGGRLR
jgi:alpha-tubulin suppressor-like RCC1 family protein